MKVNALNTSTVVLLALLLIAEARAQDAAGVAEAEAQPGITPTTQPTAASPQRQPTGPAAASLLPPVANNELMRGPRRGPKPPPRMSDGTLNRGAGGDPLVAIAPEHGGSTSRAHPTLYFHLSKPVTGEVVATLTKGQEPEPVKEWNLSNLDAGIHALEMKDTDPALEVDAKYSWVVMVRKYRGASKNPSAQTALTRVNSAPEVAGASPADRVAHLADAGLWYDAVVELLKDPSAHPGAEHASPYRELFRQALGLQRSRQTPTTSVR